MSVYWKNFLFSLFISLEFYVRFAYYITGEKQINNQSIAIVIVLTIISSVLSSTYLIRTVN